MRALGGSAIKEVVHWNLERQWCMHCYFKLQSHPGHTMHLSCFIADNFISDGNQMAKAVGCDGPLKEGPKGWDWLPGYHPVKGMEES
jgi:hypothetical protein